MKGAAFVAGIIAALSIAACTSAPKWRSPSSAAPSSKSSYYKDDGPGNALPSATLDAVPDAVPQREPLHRFANRPYTVFGREYVPATSLRAYRERGVASWYGRKFHGEKTAIGEKYDMYAMTAAHPTLPLPSYARVTSVATGKSVIVRVNDRGPFLHDRLIDLSYAAAHRIGIAQNGSGDVEVEAIIPGETTLASRPLPPVASAATESTPLPVERVPLPAASASAPHASSGYAVQLGAFASSANAQNFMEHVQNQLAASGVEPKIRQANGLFRVYVGPYSERDEARRIAERLETAFGLTTTLAPH